MSPQTALKLKRALIVLIGGFALVHASTGEGAAQRAQSKKKSEPAGVARPAAAPGDLPPAVAEMRDGILEAVRTGRIDDLQVPIAWNELPPSFSGDKGAEPIAVLRKLSADGDGRDVLAALAGIIDAGPAILPIGRDVENNRMYVWPRFAEMPLDKLSPADEVQVYRLISTAALKVMREKKRWTWWRLAIAADGTWHSFQKEE
jgi:hypothetical protein